MFNKDLTIDNLFTEDVIIDPTKTQFSKTFQNDIELDTKEIRWIFYADMEMHGRKGVDIAFPTRFEVMKTLKINKYSFLTGNDFSSGMGIIMEISRNTITLHIPKEPCFKNITFLTMGYGSGSQMTLAGPKPKLEFNNPAVVAWINSILSYLPGVENSIFEKGGDYFPNSNDERVAYTIWDRMDRIEFLDEIEKAELKKRRKEGNLTIEEAVNIEIKSAVNFYTNFSNQGVLQNTPYGYLTALLSFKNSAEEKEKKLRLSKKKEQLEKIQEYLDANQFENALKMLGEESIAKDSLKRYYKIVTDDLVYGGLNDYINVVFEKYEELEKIQADTHTQIKNELEVSVYIFINTLQMRGSDNLASKKNALESYDSQFYLTGEMLGKTAANMINKQNKTSADRKIIGKKTARTSVTFNSIMERRQAMDRINQKIIDREGAIRQSMLVKERLLIAASDIDDIPIDGIHYVYNQEESELLASAQRLNLTVGEESLNLVEVLVSRLNRGMPNKFLEITEEFIEYLKLIMGELSFVVTGTHFDWPEINNLITFNVMASDEVPWRSIDEMKDMLELTKSLDIVFPFDKRFAATKNEELNISEFLNSYPGFSLPSVKAALGKDLEKLIKLVNDHDQEIQKIYKEVEKLNTVILKAVTDGTRTENINDVGGVVKRLDAVAKSGFSKEVTGWKLLEYICDYYSNLSLPPSFNILRIMTDTERGLFTYFTTRYGGKIEIFEEEDRVYEVLLEKIHSQTMLDLVKDNKEKAIKKIKDFILHHCKEYKGEFESTNTTAYMNRLEIIKIEDPGFAEISRGMMAGVDDKFFPALDELLKKWRRTDMEGYVHGVLNQGIGDILALTEIKKNVKEPEVVFETTAINLIKKLAAITKPYDVDAFKINEVDYDIMDSLLTGIFLNKYLAFIPIAELSKDRYLAANVSEVKLNNYTVVTFEDLLAQSARRRGDDGDVAMMTSDTKKQAIDFAIEKLKKHDINTIPIMMFYEFINDRFKKRLSDVNFNRNTLTDEGTPLRIIMDGNTFRQMPVYIYDDLLRKKNIGAQNTIGQALTLTRIVNLVPYEETLMINDPTETSTDLEWDPLIQSTPSGLSFYDDDIPRPTNLPGLEALRTPSILSEINVITPGFIQQPPPTDPALALQFLNNRTEVQNLLNEYEVSTPGPTDTQDMFVISDTLAPIPELPETSQQPVVPTPPATRPSSPIPLESDILTEEEQLEEQPPRQQQATRKTTTTVSIEAADFIAYLRLKTLEQQMVDELKSILPPDTEEEEEEEE